ncbi:DNA mismatch repair endonuclease MutH [Candidatus Schneideria nysicola]|uniref:DNA mismatch repair endonuclease MutH n=1 Tax=Candidatus Schneideria nysicola TaxID=1081631 RepID=UPI00248CC452|nr:DNA mismatch repair endonuclease MutH [Candidatus Schneideria nysicola]
MINYIKLSYPPFPPSSQKELMDRANRLAGFNLGELATWANINIPLDLKKDKGWIGKLIEFCLGANTKSKASRDFPHLNIELKTLPIDENGIPIENTFICMINLINYHKTIWETSYLRYKISQILWIPIEGSKDITLSMRRIGIPHLWILNQNKLEELILQYDWESLMNLIVLGKIQSIYNFSGELIQISSKRKNHLSLTPAIDQNGKIILVSPCGFYFKKSFTKKIIKSFFD